MTLHNKKSTRILNGYRVIYLPEHPRAMKNHNWNGYVYEHIVIAESTLGRRIRKSEVVHHLNLNRGDNRIDNLLVLERGQHVKLHSWLDKGAPGWQQSGENRVNSGKSKVEEPKYCEICDKTVQRDGTKYCSQKCSHFGTRRAERPSKEKLEHEINTMSFSALGRKYNVSDNAVRKWARTYDLL